MSNPPIAPTAKTSSNSSQARSQFLLVIYKSMWDNINRHILVVWQSFAALFTALAASYLSGKEILSPDFATALILLAAGWSMAHAIDASGWYNRNLLIITNIEREFLTHSDLRDIHYFFGKHRDNRPIEHLIIQMLLAGAIATLALLHHFATRVWPGRSQSICFFEPSRTIPYIVGIVLVGALVWFYRSLGRKYAKLDAGSPGKPMQA